MHKRPCLPLDQLVATPTRNASERARLKRRLQHHASTHCVALGPHLALMFEDGWTSHLAAQGWLPLMEGTTPALQQTAIGIGAATAPAIAGWTALVRLQWPLLPLQQPQPLRDILAQVCLELPQHNRVAATVLGALPPGTLPGAALLRVRFSPSAPACRRLCADADPAILLVSNHVRYWHRRLLPVALRRSLLQQVATAAALPEQLQPSPPACMPD